MRKKENKYLNFENEYCNFLPYDWATIEGISRPLLYKVVTENFQSLGLRRNPNILTFPPGRWVILDDDLIVPGKGDWGGIWCTLKISKARELGKYMKEKHKTDTKIFLTVVDKPLYANSYRIKSVGVMLLEEIKQ